MSTVLADIEALLTRGRPPDDVAKVLGPRLKQYLPLSSNTAVNSDLDKERRKDHIGHFVLRLAFCRTCVATFHPLVYISSQADNSDFASRQELRTRFIKAEAALFRIRFDTDSPDERQRFLESLNFDWQPVSTTEHHCYRIAMNLA